ncbi:MAG: hypothetical protein WAV27_23760 [Xanthobacteraceae bacterium]
MGDAPNVHDPLDGQCNRRKPIRARYFLSAEARHANATTCRRHYRAQAICSGAGLPGQPAVYRELGFQVAPLGDKIAGVSIGNFGFLLQDFFVQAWADNFVMHMMVDNLEAWWAGISTLDLAGRFGARAPRPPRLEPWGLRVAYVFDPAGILWHFAEEAEGTASRS